MEYQHNAEILNLNTGVALRGCFRTLDEAEAFVSEKRQEGFSQPFIRCGLDSQPYGITEHTFDVGRFWQKQGEWLGDHKINGGD